MRWCWIAYAATSSQPNGNPSYCHARTTYFYARSANGDIHVHSNGDTDSANGNTHVHSNGDTHAHSNSDTHVHSNGDTDSANGNTHVHSNSDTAPNHDAYPHTQWRSTDGQGGMADRWHPRGGRGNHPVQNER